MPQTLKKQALTLTIANGFTRGLGFFFRLMTARDFHSIGGLRW